MPHVLSLCCTWLTRKLVWTISEGFTPVSGASVLLHLSSPRGWLGLPHSMVVSGSWTAYTDCGFPKAEQKWRCPLQARSTTSTRSRPQHGFFGFAKVVALCFYSIWGHWHVKLLLSSFLPSWHIHLFVDNYTASKIRHHSNSIYNKIDKINTTLTENWKGSF